LLSGHGVRELAFYIVTCGAHSKTRYHFKDYLKKDPRIIAPADVEAFIASNRALSRAADLCNSFRLCVLPRRSLGYSRVSRPAEAPP
jgi:hypothetical protein